MFRHIIQQALLDARVLKKKIVFSHIQETMQYVLAHALARRVISSPHFMIWMESIPPDIKDLINASSFFLEIITTCY